MTTQPGQRTPKPTQAQAPESLDINDANTWKQVGDVADGIIARIRPRKAATE